MFKKIINLVPLFLLVSTAVQLFISGYSWYPNLYYNYLQTFHNYGIFINLYALYYSVNYSKSVVSDISIIGLIMIDITSTLIYILNGGKSLNLEEYNEALKVWSSSIAGFFIVFSIAIHYLRKDNHKIV